VASGEPNLRTSSPAKVPRRKSAKASLDEGGVPRGREKVTVLVPCDQEVSEYDRWFGVEEDV
jgi:hypothetical protein